MPKLDLQPADPPAIRWAVGREFAYLPAVDPDFRAMNPLQALLLRTLVLPLNYQRQQEGWIARQDGEPVGYLFMRRRGDAYQVESLGVIESLRRKGVAGALLDQAAQTARKEGCTVLMASVTSPNHPAKALFASQGFRPYRKERLRWAGSSFDAPPITGGWTIRELGATQSLPAYERWYKAVIQSAEGWASDVLLDLFARAGWKGSASHWGCMIGSEEAGYLRVAGLGSKHEAYLALKPTAWKLGAGVSWMHQALQIYTSSLKAMTVDMPSDAQLNAGLASWLEAGFAVEERPRYLMLLNLRAYKKMQR